MNECPFCSYSNNKSDMLLSNELAFVIADRFPVNRGHLLVIPFRHIQSVFALTSHEKLAIFALLEQARILLDQEYAPNGYNIGVNVGEAAGQTILHTHIHLIPRYAGDVSNPRGGVRGVIPSRQSY